MANHAKTTHLFGMVIGIGNHPMTRNQLSGHLPGIDDGDRIGKDIM